MSSCEIAECEAAPYARGWCKKHHQRWLRNGTTDRLVRKKPPAACSIDQCAGDAKTRGMCGMHAERARNGLPMDAPRRELCTDRDFRDLHEVVEGGCWEWRGPISSQGYGTYGAIYAHRRSYELAVGEIPDGLQVDHLCRTRSCVNPAHLEAVTPRVNTLRGIAPSAIAVQMNRCGRGHEFTPDNTYMRPDGTGRQCRSCARLRRIGVAA